MPWFCYNCDGEERWEQMTHMAREEREVIVDGKPALKIDGEVWFRDESKEPEYKELSASGVTRRTGTWPIHSESLAVPPSQVEAFREQARLNGVPTDFDKLGRPIIRSRKHQNAYWKIRNAHMKNGDVAPDQGISHVRTTVDRSAEKRQAEKVREFCWYINDKYRHKRIRR